MPRASRKTKRRRPRQALRLPEPSRQENSLSSELCACGAIKRPLRTHAHYPGKLYTFRCDACSEIEQQRLDSLREQREVEQARWVREWMIELGMIGCTPRRACRRT
jgi:hypothetical protein